MKTTVKQFIFAAPLFLAIVIISSSFSPAQKNSIARGGGIADGIYFDFNVVKQKNGNTAGHIQFRDEYYRVACADFYANYAVLYTTDGKAFYVADNGEGGGTTDWISEPIQGECGDSFSAVDFYAPHNVTDGNIQVK